MTDANIKSKLLSELEQQAIALLDRIESAYREFQLTGPIPAGKVLVVFGHNGPCQDLPTFNWRFEFAPTANDGIGETRSRMLVITSGKRDYEYIYNDMVKEPKSTFSVRNPQLFEHGEMIYLIVECCKMKTGINGVTYIKNTSEVLCPDVKN